MTVADENTTPETEAPTTEQTAPQSAPQGAAQEGPQSAPRQEVTFESFGAAFEAATDGPVAVDTSAAPQYGVGPFSVREVSLLAVWGVAFLVSFFPVFGGFGGRSIWSNGIDWILLIGAPTLAVFLLVLRRLSPQGIRRIGSLGIDQFASVTFSVSAILWLGMLWNAFVALGASGVFYISWVAWVIFVLMLAGVLLTAFAPLFPTIGDDFAGRPEVPAHRVASPARPIVARPVAPRPAATPSAPYGAPVETYGMPAHGAPVYGAPLTGSPAYGAPAYGEPAYGAPAYGEPAYSAPAHGEPAAEAPVVDAGAASAPTSDAHETAAFAPVADVATDAKVPAEAPADAPTTAVAEAETPAPSVVPPASTQPFWALAPVERDVVDETGVPIFRVGPTAWALVVEDRGTNYVIRHEDGRIGYLLDVSGITRG